MTLEHVNALSPVECATQFASCCGARRWIDAMIARRPFTSEAALSSAADEIWRSLGPDDWREAFSHHPRIGERAATAPATNQSKTWSANEQSRVIDAGQSVRDSLARANADYERKFGYTYIVRAAGRSAEEMLAMANERLDNDPVTELRVAAEQQREIMQLRLAKLLHHDTNAGV